ncbi:shikimate kinase [Chloroflexota bacterium]
MRGNIALIGFMGTGKTAVGEVLAEKLGMKFIEQDLLIEKQAGKSISKIFQEDGEIAFREIEIEVTKKIAREKKIVIACGGGVVLNQINIDRLKENAMIIYLKASPEIILDRVTNDKVQRPLLEVANPAQTISELIKFREPFYKRAACITINTSKSDVNSVAKKIIKRLKKHESLNTKK